MNKSIPYLHTEIMAYAVKIAEPIVSEQLARKFHPTDKKLAKPQV
jgi:hypothetical protein